MLCWAGFLVVLLPPLSLIATVPPRSSPSMPPQSCHAPRSAGGRGPRWWTQRQDERRDRCLEEVEFGREFPEDRYVLANRQAAVGPSVGPRVEPLASQEVVLDELEVRVEGELLVVDEP